MVAIIRAWRMVPCILSLAFRALDSSMFHDKFSTTLFSLAPRNEKFSPILVSLFSFFWFGGSKGKGKQSSRWSRKSLKSERYSSWLTSKGAGEAFTLRISGFGARFIGWNSLFWKKFFRFLLTRNFALQFWCLTRNRSSSDWKFGWKKFWRFSEDWIDLNSNWIKWWLHN